MTEKRAKPSDMERSTSPDALEGRVAALLAIQARLVQGYPGDAAFRKSLSEKVVELRDLMRHSDTSEATRLYLGGVVWVYVWHLYHLGGGRPPEDRRMMGRIGF